MHNHRFVQLVLALACLSAWGNSIAAADSSLIVNDGTSPYQIVVAEQASPSEQQAAKDLQTYITKCTGATLPIVHEPGSAPMIVVGLGTAAEQLGVHPSPESLGPQGYVIKTVSPHLVIAGTPEVGTLYGVYDFLDTYLGVRWLAPDEILTPHLSTLALPSVDTVKKPWLLWRHTCYAWRGGGDEFRAKHRDNDGAFDPASPFGLKYHFNGRCHSYFSYISPNEFYDSHPEYFSEINGIRQKNETQLCLTNPDVLEIVAKRMLEKMATSSYWQYNFSQMDYYNFCECPKCKAINEQYGTRGGTQFWFLNQLAERTSKVYPNKYIGTLAYMYTEEPPRDLVIHPNVAVWLCHMYPCCDSHPIATCPLNAEYKRRAEAWSKISSHLYIWHYIVDFAHYYTPFPNFGAIAADMKFYKQIGVEGVYLQGMSPPGGEFGLLRPYYAMRLLNDPDRDPETVMQEFLQGYYGPAAPKMREYIKLLQDKVDTENIHMHLYVNPSQGYLSDAVLEQAGALYDAAEQLVQDNPKYLDRVKVARMPLSYARLFPRNGYTIANGILTFNPPIADTIEAATFLEQLRSHDFPTIREVAGDPNQVALLCLLFNMAHPLETIANERISVDILPILGGRILRIIDKASGQCITVNNNTKSLYFPFSGGEETRVGGTVPDNMVGIFDQFTVVESAPDHVVLECTAPNKTVIRRIMQLLPDRPELRITVDVLNKNDKPTDIRIRSHMELELGDVHTTRVHFTSRNGTTVDKDMRPIIANYREGERYGDQDTPNGTWTFSGDKGLTLTHRFDPESVEYAWLYAYPDTLNDLEWEVAGKTTTVEPRSHVQFVHSLEVQPSVSK